MSRYLKTLFPITVVVLFLAAIFTFRGEAQQPTKQPLVLANGERMIANGDKPVSAVAVAFAESDAVRDMPDADVVNASADRLGDGDGEEKNLDNVALGEFKRAQISAYRAAHPEQKFFPSVDGATRATVPSPSLPGGPIANFDGMTANDGVTTTGSIVAPSDENIGVGPKHVVQTTNTGFRIWDKAGNPLVPPKAIKSLFSKLGGVCATFERGDPIVLHDRLADRWIISQFDFADANKAPFFECIAVSKTSDPTGSYYTYAFQTPTETPPNPTPGPGQNFPDYPHMSTWIDGYYMTVNQFDRSKPSGQFNGMGAYAFDRSKMLVGNPTASFIYFNLNLSSHPEGVASVQPADIDGFQLPGTGQPCPFAYEISDEYEIPPFNVDGIRMFNFHADFTVPANSTFTERAESPVALDPYDPRSPEFEVGSRAEIQQPAPANGTSDSYNAIDYHLMYRLQYRRFGANENLTSAFMVNISGVQPTTAATYQAAFRYVQLHTTTLGGAYSKFDNATFAPDPIVPDGGNDRSLPSAAIDNQGNLAVSYSISGRTAGIPPSLRYAGRDFNAAGFPMAGLSGEQTLFAGTGVQIGTSNRWGDYQSLQVDPVDDCTFWTTNQYYNTTNLTFNWRTRIGSFKFPTCTAPDQGTVTGTITSCETGAPISGALIQFNNGFSTTSGPDGKYTIQLASGPVQTQVNYTMTVSDPARLCTQSGTFLTPVAKDAVTVQDVCLNGTANPILDTTDSNAIVVTGGNGDGKIGPSECNIMNIRLTNTGCATAKNLKATLTSSTPGVTVMPPGTASYPNIVIDGASFGSTPFRVSTDATVQCGTINFTLTTNFDGGSTVTNFTLPSACGTLPDQVVNGSIDPADPDTTTGRLGRANPPSACSAPKACPGALGTGGRSFDDIPFVNGPGLACITVTPTPNGLGTILAGAYLGSFDPTNVCTNYLADQGATFQPFSFNVPAGATFHVVVMEANAGTASTPYTITVSGISAPATPGSGPCAAAITTQATAAATVGQPISDTATLTTGGNPTGTITFKLFGPGNATCSGAPIFTSVVGVNGDGGYVSQSFTPAAAGTYNWIASYSGDGNNPAATGACGDPNETTTVAAIPTPSPTATATATATASATATATATPTATPASQTLNLSTRMRTDTGDNVGIGGFTISGSAAKHVLVRAIGPSLTKFGFTTAEVLADPTLEVHGPGAFGTITNNNWRDSQEAQIKSDGLAPTNDLESAIDAVLPPGTYTAIIRGNTGTPQAGLCLFEVYDLDTAAASKLSNLSTRAFVGTGNNVVIAGFVLGNNQGNDRIVVRGLGPSLSSFGIANTLADPTLELRDENGSLLFADNDWQDNSAQAAEIMADGLAPSNAKEAAIAATLPPGLYTAILAGLNNGQGVGIVEIYDLGP
jgi:hypothetical protein